MPGGNSGKVGLFDIEPERANVSALMFGLEFGFRIWLFSGLFIMDFYGTW